MMLSLVCLRILKVLWEVNYSRIIVPLSPFYFCFYYFSLLTRPHTKFDDIDNIVNFLHIHNVIYSEYLRNFKSKTLYVFVQSFPHIITYIILYVKPDLTVPYSL